MPVPAYTKCTLISLPRGLAHLSWVLDAGTRVRERRRRPAEASWRARSCLGAQRGNRRESRAKVYFLIPEPRRRLPLSKALCRLEW